MKHLLWIITLALLLNGCAHRRPLSVFEAVSQGQKKRTMEFLEKGADVHHRYRDGLTLLHVATRKGWTEIALMLLQEGAEIHARDDRQLCPIHYGVESGKLEMVQLLLKKGANPNAKGLFLYDPTKNLEAEWNALHIAVWKDDLEILTLLKESGGDLSMQAGNGDTLLHIAALFESEDCAEYLLNQNPELNPTQPETGFTPLHLAARHNAEKVAELLLEKGADAGAKAAFYEDYTPLHLAVFHGNYGLVKLLIQHEAPINALTSKGDSPLQLARELSMDSLLRENGAE